MLLRIGPIAVSTSRSSKGCQDETDLEAEVPLALIAGCGRNGAKFCPCTYDEKAMNPILLATLLAASLVAALFGQGGGVLYTPIQVATRSGRRSST